MIIEVAEATLDAYDLNGNDTKERDEVLAAVKDYFAGEIGKERVIELVNLYFDV